jgi:hypothetical protein
MHFGGGHPQQRGLARAVGAEYDPAFVELHLPGDRADEGMARAADGDVGEIDEQIGIRLRHALHLGSKAGRTYDRPAYRR